MNEMNSKKRLSPKRHYKNKLKYELVYSGYVIDLVIERKYIRKTKNLLYRMEFNENRLYVNPLGVKTELIPF